MSVSCASRADAVAILERSLGPGAAFRPHQWETIDALVNDHARLLVVQRTGYVLASGAEIACVDSVRVPPPRPFPRSKPVA